MLADVSFEPLISEKAAADILGVSMDTIQRIRKRGEIGFRKIGCRYKYTVSDLNEYSDNQRIAPCQREKSAKSEGSGSQNGRGRLSGTSPGSTSGHDRHVASQLAASIFGKPK
ncbi:helix-turn-helix domain-containing protein [Asticcacaulis sp. SL142]|uniref:helix-turn-helix domain-containing protein n=1 Tax=Asticcacaulis sp. SL142 TaxID=2995155 RepID=UPI00226D096F|nr:helix-turn-helix domain-containing protein [Asticcacaulis sp. SL142]WAC49732.1 helix-turn-helix domain-containing protein [Asticcacaulis sp. SL142]